jgi:hypothetical protein
VLALLEAAIMLVEIADKIQTRIFDGCTHAQPLLRRRQSKGRTRRFAADSAAFSMWWFRMRSMKDRADHAQTGKLCRPCRPPGGCEKP